MRLRLDWTEGMGPGTVDRGWGTGSPGLSAGLGLGRSPRYGHLLGKMLRGEPGLDQCQSGKKEGIKVKRTEVFLAAMGQIE